MWYWLRVVCSSELVDVEPPHTGLHTAHTREDAIKKIGTYSNVEAHRLSSSSLDTAERSSPLLLLTGYVQGTSKNLTRTRMFFLGDYTASGRTPLLRGLSSSSSYRRHFGIRFVSSHDHCLAKVHVYASIESLVFHPDV
jgi:hypothetical protein